jgi:hypothetical protein
MEIQATFVVQTNDGLVTLSPDKHPQTYRFVLENISRIAKTSAELTSGGFVSEFYFITADFVVFRDEFYGSDYQYDGVNFFLSDGNTIAFQIRKLY